MTVSWFICPYKQIAGTKVPIRYCAMDDFTALIVADGGAWAESEVLGGWAIVKVRASDATLSTINAATGFLRVPNNLRLSDLLSSLSGAQLTAINNRLLAMGYTQTEINNALGGNLSTVTLGQVLRFAATRRRKPRYDSATGTIILDGDIQPCWPVDNVDGEVQ